MQGVIQTPLWAGWVDSYALLDADKNRMCVWKSSKDVNRKPVTELKLLEGSRLQNYKRDPNGLIVTDAKDKKLVFRLASKEEFDRWLSSLKSVGVAVPAACIDTKETEKNKNEEGRKEQKEEQEKEEKKGTQKKKNVRQIQLSSWAVFASAKVPLVKRKDEEKEDTGRSREETKEKKKERNAKVSRKRKRKAEEEKEEDKENVHSNGKNKRKREPKKKGRTRKEKEEKEKEEEEENEDEEKDTASLRRSNRRRNAKERKVEKEPVIEVDPAVVEYQKALLASIQQSATQTDGQENEQEKTEEKRKQGREQEKQEEDSIASRLRRNTRSAKRRRTSDGSESASGGEKKKQRRATPQVRRSNQADNEYEEEEEEEEEEEDKKEEEIPVEGNPTHYISSLLRAREIGGGPFTRLVHENPLLTQRLHGYKYCYEKPRNSIQTLNRIVTHLVQDGLHLQTARVFGGHKHNIFTLCFDNSCSVLVGAGAKGQTSVFPISSVINVDNEDGKPIPPSFTFTAHDRWISDTQFLSSDTSERHLLTSSDSGDIALWRLSLEFMNERRKRPLHRETIASTNGIFGVYSMHEKYHNIVASTKDCTIALLSLSDYRMELVRQIEDQHSDVVKCVSWRDNYVFASCGNDKLIHVFDAREPDPVVTMVGMHNLSINTVLWQPRASECQSLLLSSAFDGKINLYDIRKPDKPLHVLSDHTMGRLRMESIVHPSFYFDGDLVVTPSDKHSGIWAYRANTGECVGMLDVDIGVATIGCHDTTGALAGAKGAKVVLYEPKVFEEADGDD